MASPAAAKLQQKPQVAADLQEMPWAVAEVQEARVSGVAK